MTEENDVAIKVDQLTVAYDQTPVLVDNNVTFKKGQMTAIVGPNGAGKSTLLDSILGFLTPLNGQVTFFDGLSYNQARDQVTYVPQKQAVDWQFPATVMDVVLMGRYGKLGLFSRLSKEDRTIARDKLRAVEMLDYADRQINQLSGGQKQRIFLARALAAEAEIYLLDEPLAGVDKKTEKIIMDLLGQLTREGKTVVVVHHDLHTVEAYFDQIVFLNKKIFASGPVADIFNDETVDWTFRSGQEVEKGYEWAEF